MVQESIKDLKLYSVDKEGLLYYSTYDQKRNSASVKGFSWFKKKEREIKS